MKQIIPYTLLAVYLLSACQADDYEPTTGTSGESEMLSLTVSANDLAVTGETSTRAADNGKTTTFENGDRVGLIVLDAAGDIIADNLPYKFDGSSWDFDTGNGEGKQPAFYDPSMNTYIVYYPYDAAANNIVSVDALKALGVFAHQADQSSEDAYRQSDLMVWSSSGNPMKQIAAALTHVRNSFSLEAKVQWTLATGDVVSYTSPTLEDVIIYDKDGKQLSPYRAEDGSYRCILPDGYEGTLRWHYTCEEKTFGGKCTVSSQAKGTRYAQVETADVGEYSLDKAAPGDFYCSKEIVGANTGYLVPQEAVAFLNQHNCIGIVIHAGRHTGDTSDYSVPLYSEASHLLKGNTVHGYAVGLQDAAAKRAWGVRGKDLGCRPPKQDNKNDWSGYAWTQTIISKGAGGVNKLSTNAAGYSATYYAVVDYEKKVPAPNGTSGWFLPSIGQMWKVYLQRSMLTIPTGGKGLASKSYWSSSEIYSTPDIYASVVYVDENRIGNNRKNNTASYVRAVLAF